MKEKRTLVSTLSLWSIISLITLKFSFTLHCLSFLSTSHHFSFPLFLSLSLFSSSSSSVSSCNRTKSVPGGWIRSKLVARRSLIFQFLGGTTKRRPLLSFLEIPTDRHTKLLLPVRRLLPRSLSFHRLSITAAAQPVFFWLGKKKRKKSIIRSLGLLSPSRNGQGY